MKLSRTQIAVSGLLVLAGAGYFYSSQKASAPLFPKEAPLFGKTPTFAKPAPTPDAVQAPSQVTPPATAAKPTVASYTPKVKSVSNQVALDTSARSDYYAAVVAVCEGLRLKPYFDNSGIALGYGWNIGQQSRARNAELSQGIGLDAGSTAALVSYSGNKTPTSLPDVSITAAQASTAVQLMREGFEAPMRKLIPSFGTLAQHQKDALVYHAYKVGPSGAAKYTGMLAAIKTYSTSPTAENSLKVAESFTYKYTLNGKVYQDTHSTLWLAALWTSPEAFNYMLGKSKAPADFNQVSKIAKQTIDTSKPAEAQVKDEFGDAKEDLLRRGIPFTVKIEDTTARPVQRGNGTHFYGI